MKAEGCPWCGEAPQISKHFRDDAWRLIHRCKVMGPILIDWTYSEDRLVERWNTRPAAPQKQTKRKRQ
jgi:hypothetical protein